MATQTVLIASPDVKGVELLHTMITFYLLWSLLSEGPAMFDRLAT